MIARINIVACAVLFSLASVAVAQSKPPARNDRTDPPAPAEPARQPATTDATRKSDDKLDPAVDRILADLEKAGREKQAISCKIVHSLVIIDPVETRKEKFGELLFQRDEKGTRFKVHFNKLVADGLISRDQEFFAFDGEWFIERNDKSKTIVRRQIVRKGENTDPFALGKGPFPLPFGQKRDDILNFFSITLKPFAIGDPPGSKHLHCVPRPGTDLAQRYTRVEFYIDPTIDLPVRIVCERVADGDRIEVDFKDIETSAQIDPRRFEVPRESGFTVTDEPLGEGQAPLDLTP